MNEWLKKVMDKFKELWSKWKPIQKVILFGIIIVIIVAIIATAKLSAKPAAVRLFNAPVTDQTSQTKILDRLSQENVNADIDANGYITVADDQTARHMREVLISENLVPSSIDPWAGFYDRSWSTTDADQNVKLKNTIQKQLKQVEQVKKLENKLLPTDFDYTAIAGLRLEAQEKLNKIKPLNIGQASRISGVSPADISVLLIWLATNKNRE